MGGMRGFVNFELFTKFTKPIINFVCKILMGSVLENVYLAVQNSGQITCCHTYEKKVICFFKRLISSDTPLKRIPNFTEDLLLPQSIRLSYRTLDVKNLQWSTILSFPLIFHHIYISPDGPADERKAHRGGPHQAR